MLDGAFARPVEVVIVHVHGVRALVKSNECMDHRLATKRNRYIVVPGSSKSGSEHHLRKFLPVANDFYCRPLTLKRRKRRALYELKTNAFACG